MIQHDDARFDDLVAQLGDGDSKDLFRLLLERRMQQLIDAELTATIGAELHTRFRGAATTVDPSWNRHGRASAGERSRRHADRRTGRCSR